MKTLTPQDEIKAWKQIAHNLAGVLELELGNGRSTLHRQMEAHGLKESFMRVRLTLKHTEHSRLVAALPALREAGAQDPAVRSSKNPDGPIELSFRLDNQLQLADTLACAGLADLTPYARMA